MYCINFYFIFWRINQINKGPFSASTIDCSIVSSFIAIVNSVFITRARLNSVIGESVEKGVEPF